MSKKRAGQPTLYNLDIAKTICDRITEGKSVKKIAAMEDMPCEDSIYAWLAAHDEFSEMYTRAVEARTNRYMEECVDLADSLPVMTEWHCIDGRVLSDIEYGHLTSEQKGPLRAMPLALTTELIRARQVQIETRLKASAQMNPRKYGTKVTKTELTGKDGGPVQLESASNLSDEQLNAIAAIAKGSSHG